MEKIINSYLTSTDTMRDTVKLIEAYGWYEFSTDLESQFTLDNYQKLDFLYRAIRIKDQANFRARNALKNEIERRNKMKEMLPCPFCGSEIISTSSNGGCYGFKVFCICGASISGSYHEDKENDVIKMWNTRVQKVEE